MGRKKATPRSITRPSRSANMARAPTKPASASCSRCCIDDRDKMVLMNGAMHVSLAALILAGCAFAQDDFGSQMAKGIEAFRHAYFAESVQSFEHAVALDPKSSLAHISLALAYLQAYIAGAESPEDSAVARNAEEH